MTAPAVSVIVVSRGRPVALRRCLLGLSQVQYDPFEIIVVADPAGVAVSKEMPFAKHLKVLPFDAANISAARNLGLVHAAGEIVAFIDDDAVPEPQWLYYLIAPATHAAVAAMGGYVRGRNGISFQSRANSLDARGETQPLDLDPIQVSVLTPPKERAIKTEGTNMAFRRDVLVALGGFDPAFHFFLDETDVNMRLARSGHATAIAPLAQVHHSFAASPLRSHARVPRDLFDIGASWAVFQRKHCDEGDRKSHWAGLRQGQRLRLLRHVVDGGLEPRDMRRLMGRLDAGYADGQKRPFGAVDLPAHPAAPFERFPSEVRKSILRVTRPLFARRDMAAAVAAVKKGAIVTLVDLSPTAMFHQLRFTDDGVWVQRGGVFGRSDRDAPLFRLTTRARWVEKERKRVALPRGLPAEDTN